MRTSRRKALTKVAVYAAVIVLATAILIPVFWTVSTSLKTRVDIFATPPKFVGSIEPKNYIVPFVKERNAQFMINSVIICIGNVLICVPVSFVAAYALSRYRIRGGGMVFFASLTLRMAPAAAYVIPYFVLVRSLGLYDTHLGLMIFYSSVSLPFVLWILKSGIDSIPREVDEAALIDGCSQFNVIVRVVAPLASPAIAASTIFAFLFDWNEYLLASILTGSNARTITTGLTAFITHVGIRWGDMAAVSVVAMIPSALLIVVVSKYIISGLTLGAVKG